MVASAYLAGVEEAAHGHFRYGLIHVDIWVNDARIVAAHFQGDALEGL